MRNSKVFCKSFIVCCSLITSTNESVSAIHNKPLTVISFLFITSFLTDRGPVVFKGINQLGVFINPFVAVFLFFQEAHTCHSTCLKSLVCWVTAPRPHLRRQGCGCSWVSGDVGHKVGRARDRGRQKGNGRREGMVKGGQGGLQTPPKNIH